MEKMKHFLSSRSAIMIPPGGASDLSHSVFHVSHPDLEQTALTQDMKDCYQGIEEFCSAMRNLEGAGTHLTESLAQVLRGTGYQCVGEQLSGGFREVYGSQGSQRFLEHLRDMENMLLNQQVPIDSMQQDLKLLCAQKSCHVLLMFAKLQKQYFEMCHSKMTTLIKHFLAAKDPQLSGEVTKLILKVGLAEELSSEKTNFSCPNTPHGSPKLGKPSSQQGSPKLPRFRFLWFHERSKGPAVEGNSAFYVNVPDANTVSGAAVTHDLVDLTSLPPAAGSLSSSLSLNTSSSSSSHGSSSSSSLQTAMSTLPLLSPSPVGFHLGSIVPDPGLAVGAPTGQRPVGEPTPNSSVVKSQGQGEGSLQCSVPLVTRTDEMNNECSPDFTLEDSAAGHLASEEDLDSVINLLSGINCFSPLHSPTPNSMLSIPEDLYRDPSPSTPNSIHSGPELHPLRSPNQLTVPAMYRMRSPASDSQVDELHLSKMPSQIHRRSEGCLDLSGVTRSVSWTQQQQLLHHRASLPAVQLHSPHHYPHSLDPTHDPCGHGRYMSHDFVSVPPGPPPSYLGSKGGGDGDGASGLQWSTYGGGSGVEMRSGTWPLYQPLTMPMSDSLNSSWSGAHDGSEGSDDSSNGDHFFAVGKDLATAIDSRHESSDDEVDSGTHKAHSDFFDYDYQVGCTNTWPMMQQLSSSAFQFTSTSNYPDMMNPPPPPHPTHRPVQMQWSDPLSTRNVWSAADPGSVAGHKSNQGLPSAPNHSQPMHHFGQLH